MTDTALTSNPVRIETITLTVESAKGPERESDEHRGTPFRAASRNQVIGHPSLEEELSASFHHEVSPV